MMPIKCEKLAVSRVSAPPRCLKFQKGPVKKPPVGGMLFAHNLLNIPLSKKYHSITFCYVDIVTIIISIDIYF